MFYVPMATAMCFNVPLLEIVAEKKVDTVEILPLLPLGILWHSDCAFHVHSNSPPLHVCWGLQINIVVQLVVQ